LLAILAHFGVSDDLIAVENVPRSKEVIHVLRGRNFRLIVALVIALVALAPRGLNGNVFIGEASVFAAALQDSDSSSGAERKGGFGRKLAAPFRGIARLFGGGKKAKKEAPKNTESSSAPSQAAATQRVEAQQPRVETTTSSAAPGTSEGTRIVRAPADLAPAKPGMWIPVIDGIPRDPLSQGRALLFHGYANEAVSELLIATTGERDLVEANNLLGLAYDKLGLHRSAIEAYERALSVSPKHPIVIANLGSSHYYDANYHAALKRLKQAAKLSGDTPLIHSNLGVVQAQLGKFDDAFKSFARAGGAYDAHIKVAGFLETAKREKDAARHYEAALKIQPGTNALLERLVVLYEKTGKREKAESARRALGPPKNEQKTTTGGGG
jgi:Flp pilus assembly protein TadD